MIMDLIIMACRSCGIDSIQVCGGFHNVWNACTIIYERLGRTLQFVSAFAHTKGIYKMLSI